MANFKHAIAKTLLHEGGYVNDPDDKGGETNYGISKRSYPDVDIKNLTKDEAKAIYKCDYWDKVRGDHIESQAVAENLFDTAVNMGHARAAKLAQAISGTTVDGIFGRMSQESVNAMNEESFIDKYKLAKIDYYVKICLNSSVQKKFLLGWIRRTLEG